MDANTFSKAARKILSLKVEDFISKYRDLLPQYGVVGEEENIAKIIELIGNNKHYIIVVDKKNKLRGIITYLDVLLMLGGPKATAVFLPLSSIASSLRRIKVSSDVLPRISVRKIMEREPHRVKLEETIEEAIDVMEKSHTHYVVVVDKEGKVKGIITAHAILRAVLEEMKS